MSGRLNSPCYKVLLAFVLTLACGASSARAGGFGFDAGQEPNYYAANLAAADLTGIHGGWLRARGLAGSGGEGDHAGRSVEADRAGIKALHARGVKICVILRWPPGEWIHGGRKGGGHRLALDLREPYERARKLAEIYGDIVDAWEIENEPDISFILDNPETYAAFFKATSLGITAGVENAKKRAAQSNGNALTHPPSVGSKSAISTTPFAAEISGHRSPWSSNKRGQNNTGLKHSETTPSGPVGAFESRVVMAPLALPPGPYFESLWANDLGSYTDAFNFHYYGYSQDFTGVYRQFENAVSITPMPATIALSNPSTNSVTDTAETKKTRSRRSAPIRIFSKSKSLPVFITEYGLGLLDGDARNTIAGRVRQWNWFTDLARQIHQLKPEAPMAFALNPYLEGGINEFGLSMETRPRFTGDRAPPPVPTISQPAPTSIATITSSDAKSPAATPPNLPGLTFTAADFGAKSSKPWMRFIGEKFGSGYASPALAALWDYSAQNPYRSRTWPVKTNAPSPVVIDFVAGPDMVQIKAAGGYSLQSASAQWSPATLRTGRGNWVIYNFGPSAVAGTMQFDPPELVTPQTTGLITLAAGERREIPVEFTIPAEEWTRHALNVRFVPTRATVPAAFFKTAVVPATYTMVNTRVRDLRDITAAPSIIAGQQNRPLAVGEPRLQLDGRWLKTEGIRVVDDQRGHWRFEIDRLPAEPLRPAMVELPLPLDFEFTPDTALWFEYRSAPLAPRLTASTDGEITKRPLAHHGASSMDVYFRTANGNLFQTWPRLQVRPQWNTYNEDARHFTMAFFGRAQLPWSFVANKPVALVFFLRPASLPTAFEVRGASIIKLQEL